MSSHTSPPTGSSRNFDASRRDFIRTSSGFAAAALAAPLVGRAAQGVNMPTSETLVTTFYKSLSEAQRAGICFPFDHDLRLKVDNNWHITKPRLAEFFNPDQQAMVKEIFLNLHSEAYAEAVYGQVVHDSGNGGFGSSSVAVFGEPGSGKFEFVLTGRHCTRRCDGDSVEGAAFGGPIFYGHAAEDFNEEAHHPGNVYWFQAKRANELFQALDGKQRDLALLGRSRGERGVETIKLTGQTEGLAGIPVSAFSSDQKDLARRVMADLLAPFRQVDVDESMKCIEKNGFDNLHMSFYKDEDIGNDQIWDVWQVEGPTMVWYFRGKPHVHTWVHIREHV
ncbi:MAG: DUF3500 domain-containing protein [Verrucomicrobia bacterium]|nr:DUF3500 domain-containing protein [Verrucomicrobiota bacterium]